MANNLFVHYPYSHSWIQGPKGNSRRNEYRDASILSKVVHLGASLPGFRNGYSILLDAGFRTYFSSALWPNIASIYDKLLTKNIKRKHISGCFENITWMAVSLEPEIWGKMAIQWSYFPYTSFIFVYIFYVMSTLAPMREFSSTHARSRQ